MSIRPNAFMNGAVARLAACAGLALALAGALMPVRAEDAGIKDGAKQTGHAVGSVAREIGRGAKRAGKSIGSAAKEGGREFRRALKGQSD